jgi:hypothetical protein
MISETRATSHVAVGAFRETLAVDVSTRQGSSESPSVSGLSIAPVPCPSCGGSSRRELAPGFFRCQTMLTGLAPTGAHPSGSQGPTEHPYSYECGATYQEALRSLELGLCYVCASLGAVGLCAECRRATCGVHGEIRPDGLWCPECRERRQADDVRRTTEARQAAAAAAELNALPTVEYLRSVTKSDRSATARRCYAWSFLELLRRQGWIVARSAHAGCR